MIDQNIILIILGVWALIGAVLVSTTIYLDKFWPFSLFMVGSVAVCGVALIYIGIIGL